MTEMKPAFCDRHKMQNFVLTSPSLAAVVKGDQDIFVGEIAQLTIYSFGKEFRYFVDFKFLNSFDIVPENGVVLLYDKDKLNRKMNDRLLIQKLTIEMKWVCPVCLSEKVEEIGSTK